MTTDVVIGFPCSLESSHTGFLISLLQAIGILRSNLVHFPCIARSNELSWWGDSFTIGSISGWLVQVCRNASFIRFHDIELTSWEFEKYAWVALSH